MANMPAVTSMLKRQFCLGIYEECSRYVVCQKLGKEKVPADLFPHQIERISVILGAS